MITAKESPQQDDRTYDLPFAAQQFLSFPDRRPAKRSTLLVVSTPVMMTPVRV
jgi:hypothetical protein